VAIVHGLYRIIENTNVCTEFVLLEVKVPIVFLGTVEPGSGWNKRTNNIRRIVVTAQKHSWILSPFYRTSVCLAHLGEEFWPPNSIYVSPPKCGGKASKCDEIARLRLRSQVAVGGMRCDCKESRWELPREEMNRLMTSTKYSIL
jgi:hypothetical protein